MARKLVSLPVVTSIVDDGIDARRNPPTVEDARKQLGGRAASTRPVGAVVGVRDKEGALRPAVVMFANEHETFVWIGDGIVRRLRAGELTEPIDDANTASGATDLASVAADVRVFASLSESQPVRYQLAGSAMQDGVLLEKCRFGALVTTPEGRTMAISFRLLWPKPDDARSS